MKPVSNFYVTDFTLLVSSLYDQPKKTGNEVFTGDHPCEYGVNILLIRVVYQASHEVFKKRFVLCY
jgi:hypothetical protein